jgi:hypothetical protein
MSTLSTLAPFIGVSFSAIEQRLFDVEFNDVYLRHLTASFTQFIIIITSVA